MSPEEVNPLDPAEQARFEALDAVANTYLDKEDTEFLAEMDDEGERVGYVYGRLLELGEDPERILLDTGVTEADDEV